MRGHDGIVAGKADFTLCDLTCCVFGRPKMTRFNNKGNYLTMIYRVVLNTMTRGEGISIQTSLRNPTSLQQLPPERDAVLMQIHLAVIYHICFYHMR